MRRVAPRLIIIGGHTRGVGKTAVAEHLLRSRPHERWAAVKISAHRHAPAGSVAPVIEEAFEPSAATQTGRYLAAGAARAWLLRCPTDSLEDAAAFVTGLREEGWSVLVESNRIVRYLSPDAVLFVVSAHTRDWKASSAESLQRADAIVLSAGSSGLPACAHALGGPRVARLPTFGFTRDWEMTGLDRWVSAMDARPEGVVFSFT